MQEPPHPQGLQASPPAPGAATLDTRDVPPLLQLTARLATVVHTDPRAWRMELLAALCGLLPASAAMSLILRGGATHTLPQVVSLFDSGFKAEARPIVLQEFNTAPLADPLSRRALSHFSAHQPALYTARRSDLVDDQSWRSDPHVRTFRQPADTDDCIISLQRGSRGFTYALYAFRAAPHAGQPAAPPFGARERTLVDVLHAGLAWLYHQEESRHRVNAASALAPRLRQTLECLLSGDTERQVALKLSLSVHTVHDYVKALYMHFGVSRRSELIAKLGQASGPPPRGDTP